MSGTIRRVRFSLERSWLDQWAHWRERQKYDGLGSTPQHIIAKLMEYETRLGPTRYESETLIEDTPLMVELFMRELSIADVIIHACLDARHRHCVNGKQLDFTWRHGRARPATETDMAELILQREGEAGRRDFQRHCDEGYRRLRAFNRHTPHLDMACP